MGDLGSNPDARVVAPVFARRALSLGKMGIARAFYTISSCEVCARMIQEG